MNARYRCLHVSFPRNRRRKPYVIRHFAEALDVQCGTVIVARVNMQHNLEFALMFVS